MSLESIMESAPRGRHLRDARASEVAGGSNEALKNTVAKMLLPIAGLELAKAGETGKS